MSDYIYCENCEQLTRVDEMTDNLLNYAFCMVCGAEGKDLIYYAS